MPQRARKSILHGLYRQYVADQDCARFAGAVVRRYTMGTLERLASAADRMTRRAAVLALGLTADYQANSTLAAALVDTDRGVRILAETAIQQLWQRAGVAGERKRLKHIIALVSRKRFAEAIQLATKLLEDAPLLAEAWNQRAVALYAANRFRESAEDCQRALQINPHHFGAATGLGHCQLKLGNRHDALESFRRALKLNPNLDGIRAQILYLQRALKSQE